jgi:hypothetical protein
VYKWPGHQKAVHYLDFGLDESQDAEIAYYLFWVWVEINPFHEWKKDK